MFLICSGCSPLEPVQICTEMAPSQPLGSASDDSEMLIIGPWDPPRGVIGNLEIFGAFIARKSLINRCFAVKSLEIIGRGLKDFEAPAEIF